MQIKQTRYREHLLRFIKVFLPFIILIIIFVTSLLINQSKDQKLGDATSASVTINPTRNQQEVSSDITEITVAQEQSSISTPPDSNDPQKNQETPSLPTQTPFPDNLNVELLGPPNGSKFDPTSEISFIWIWPAALEPGQKFLLTFVTGTSEFIIGSTETSNLGTNGYQLTFSPVGFADLGEEALWRIQLVDTNSDIILLESEERLINFALNNN